MKYTRIKLWIDYKSQSVLKLAIKWNILHLICTIIARCFFLLLILNRYALDIDLELNNLGAIESTGKYQDGSTVAFFAPAPGYIGVINVLNSHSKFHLQLLSVHRLMTTVIWLYFQPITRVHEI
jgi:hypothetical protein